MVYDGGKLFFVVTSASRQKMVEIRPWMLNESDYCLDTAASFNPRLVIFVGGLSRSVTAGKYIVRSAQFVIYARNSCES